MDLLIGLSLSVVVFAGIYLAIYIHQQKQRKKIKEKLKEFGKITEVNTEAFDLILTINETKVAVKILLLSGNKELSINSKRHWQVDASTKKLKLLKTGGFERLKKPKILIVSPPVEKIVKYINESEIVFVKYDELCFDFYLFKVNEIDKIKEVIK